MTSVASTHGHAHSAWKDSGVAPNVLPSIPQNLTQMSYGSHAVQLGNKLTPEQTKSAPRVSWPADPNRLYTLLFLDPDAPSRDDPKMGPWCHWVVVNIPGDDIAKGETLIPYNGPTPPQGTGYHRYIISAWEQHEKLDGGADKLKQINISSSHRAKFNYESFLKQYKTHPNLVSGNFFLAQHE